LLCFLLAGCATPPRPLAAPAFFPPAPAEPRIQYLTSYSKPEDFEAARSRFLTFLVGVPPPRMPIAKPYGVACKRGRIMVADTAAAAIHVLDLPSRKWTLFAPAGPGKLCKPINVDVDEDGTLYVADVERGDVPVFASRGAYRGCIVGHTNMQPVDVLVASERVYVADIRNQRVDVYDKATRQPLFAIPAATNEAAQRLFGPTNLALDQEGRLYVSDSRAFRVQEYGPLGEFRRTLGRHGDAPGAFARNKGVAVDREGRLYVVDAATEAVQIFDREGRLLLFFGDPAGSEKPLVLPAAVAIAYDGVDFFRKYAAPDFELEYLILVTSQYGDRKVNVYGFGHRRAKSK
jgi:sugar lactone lactonase YvrE